MVQLNATVMPNLDISPAVGAGNAASPGFASRLQDPYVAPTIYAALHMPLSQLSQSLSCLKLECLGDGVGSPCKCKACGPGWLCTSILKAMHLLSWDSAYPADQSGLQQ